jgi:hypothetical protein
MSTEALYAVFAQTLHVDMNRVVSIDTSGPLGFVCPPE